MRFKIIYWALVVITFLFSCKVEDITQYAPTKEETYPQDTLLERLENKRAMIIIAHDDDMCTMAGTISKLNRQGWAICVLSFHKGNERDKAHKRACRQVLDTVAFFNLEYTQWRKDSLKELYIPKEKYDTVFDKIIVEKELKKHVNDYKPSVIFTLDNEIGGYGHCEHVFLSQLVLDNAVSLNVDYIYQAVYTKHMTTTIMARHSRRMKEWGFPGNEWERAKQMYKVDGMPLPTVQIDITSEAKNKMNFLRSYNKRERKSIGFFVPAFQEYSAEDYFTVFNREFFRVIKIK